MASDANSDIRVLLCSDNYASEYHDRITITADVPFRVSGQGTERHYQAGEQVELTMQSNEFLQVQLQPLAYSPIKVLVLLSNIMH